MVMWMHYKSGFGLSSAQYTQIMQNLNVCCIHLLMHALVNILAANQKRWFGLMKYAGAVL